MLASRLTVVINNNPNFFAWVVNNGGIQRYPAITLTGMSLSGVHLFFFPLCEMSTGLKESAFVMKVDLRGPVSLRWALEQQRPIWWFFFFESRLPVDTEDRRLSVWFQEFPAS